MKVELTNTTKKLCVIGDPVLHSKSPLIHNTMLAALGMDYVYLCQPVPRGGAGEWLRCAKFAGYAGFNATMPHKEDLFPLMDETDEDARLYRAVNTVCIKEGKVYGYNTDGRGFLRALEDLDTTPDWKNVLLLGTGGAARAVALKLVQQGATLEDAFWLANRQELDQRRRAASRQAAINAAPGKSHLSAGVAREAGEPVEVPADLAESYREMMPGATDGEIRAAYARYLKDIGK